ncbi:MAG: putative cell wall-binding protein, partial [Glaciecola sp.]
RAHPSFASLRGSNRHATAALVARFFFPNPTAIAIARSDAFPDALAAAGHLANHPGPLLLTSPDTLASEADAYLRDTAASQPDLLILGGDRAITPAVLAKIRAITGA